ncbi:MAG: protein kinase [Deltaproteobacteria bacterium]|nr:protein kinase [Deltaproteobacteria bacterium]MBK8713849.1 protein kinase [Deltaproteobacteria bacterium]MBP7291311.1 protein kinase [Nannocystaceae bacterium]
MAVRANISARRHRASVATATRLDPWFAPSVALVSLILDGPGTDHVDDDTAVALFAGELSPARAHEVRRHAVACEACRQYLAQLARVWGSDDTVGRVGELERLRAGALIGRYRLLRPIGRGGMGEVWAARDPSLDREVAVKVLRVDLDVARVGSIIEEATWLAQVSHPNVVEVFEVVRLAEGAALVMELVAGETLLLWQRRPGRTTAEIVACYRQALAGLAAAHAVGVTHGDFKPHNVLVGDDARARVVDFGLASSTGVTADGASASRSTPRGTAAYMAPELWKGGVADARSDQFSFCASLWEALAGARAFEGDDIDSLRRAVLAGELTPPPRPLPRALAAVLRRGLSPEPERRWPDLAGLGDALASAARPHGFASAAALLTVVACLSAVFALPRGADDTCDDVDGSRVATWDDDAAAFTTQQLVDGAGEDYRRPAAFVTRAASRAVQQWRSEFAIACEAPRERGRDRRACLERQRALLLRWFDAVGDVDLTRTRADGVVADLPRPTDCRLARDEPVGESFDAVLRRRLSATAREIDEDATDESRARANALLLQARDAASPATIAIAEGVWGYALLRDHEYEAALAASSRAHLGALAVGDTLLAADSAKVAASMAVELGRVDDARRWLRHFEVSGDPEAPDFAAEVHMIAADIAYIAREYEIADGELAQALSLAAADSPMRPRALGLRGRRLLEGGHIREAIPAYEEMIEFVATHTGPRSPDIAVALEGLGVARAMLGQTEAAIEAFDDARSIVLERWGYDSERHDELIGNYAQVLALAGRREAARDLLAEVAVRRRARQGAEDPALVLYYVTVAKFETELGDHCAALRWLDDAAEIDRVNGSQSSFLAASIRAAALDGVGEYDAALAVWDEAREVAADDIDRHAAELGRARIYAATREWVAAAAAISRAREFEAALGPEFSLRRGDMERLAALIATRSGQPKLAREAIARARRALAQSALPDDRGIEADLRERERELDAPTVRGRAATASAADARRR